MKRYAALLCCGVLLFWWLLSGSPAAVSAAGRSGAEAPDRGGNGVFKGNCMMPHRADF